MTTNTTNEIRGFGFIEYASHDADYLDRLFRRLGFTAIKKHKEKDIILYRQGGIDFLLNNTKGSFAEDFTQAHGPCANGFSIMFDDAEAADPPH